MFFMHNDFPDLQEKLFRAVYPVSKRPDFWKKNGTLSSAALKDKNGLSVVRTGDRQEIDGLEEVKRKFKGHIISLKVKDCNEVKALIRLDNPFNPKNPYHCEIHGSLTEIELSDEQCKRLARKAEIELKREA